MQMIEIAIFNSLTVSLNTVTVRTMIFFYSIYRNYGFLLLSSISKISRIRIKVINTSFFIINYLNKYTVLCGSIILYYHRVRRTAAAAVRSI